MTVTLESLRKSIGKKKVNSQAFAWLADFERESGDLDTSLERIDGGLGKGMLEQRSLEADHRAVGIVIPAVMCAAAAEARMLARTAVLVELR